MPQSNRPVPAVKWSRFRPQEWYTLNPLTRSLPGTLWVFGDRRQREQETDRMPRMPYTPRSGGGRGGDTP